MGFGPRHGCETRETRVILYHIASAPARSTDPQATAGRDGRVGSLSAPCMEQSDPTNGARHLLGGAEPSVAVTDGLKQVHE